MRGGRTLILLGVVLLLGAIVIFILASQGGQPTPAPEGTPTVTPTPFVPTTKIVVAAQNIPRGKIITKDAVALASWPQDSVPPGAFTSMDDVQNLIARTDILYNQPLMDVMLTNDRAQLSARGSIAALFIPNDKRAVALPIDQLASVGYAIQPGDHVDVLASFWLVDVNRDGQYPAIPFNRNLLDELTASGLDAAAATAQVVQLTTSKTPFPRLSSQMILQDVEVLSVGDWREPTALPRFTPGPPEQPSPTPAQPQAPGTPTPTLPRPNVVLLIVTPQQALVLQWLRESNAIVDLALRGAADRAPVDTTSVTLQYLFDNFNITLPPKLDFAVNFVPSAERPACAERWAKNGCR
jgi:pilus assembly protein CpaB